MGVPDKGRACEIRVEAGHSATVVKAVFDLLMTKSPEFLFTLELNFTQADGLFLGYQLAVEVNVCGYTFVFEL